MAEDKIILEVVDKLPDYFQKKFKKIEYYLHAEGVKPSNIKHVIANLEMDRQKLKRRMVNDRELMEWMKSKPRNSVRNQSMINFAAKDLNEMERSLIDMNERIQTMQAIESGLKRKGVDIARVGRTVEDVNRLKVMREEESQKGSKKALDRKIRRK